MLHRFLKCIVIKCDKFIYLAPCSKDVYTFIVILAQLWLLGNHNEFVSKSAITVAKKCLNCTLYMSWFCLFLSAIGHSYEEL